jgi:hypothetical protein
MKIMPENLSLPGKYLRLSEINEDTVLSRTGFAQYPGSHCAFFGVAGMVPLIKNSYALLLGPAICLYNAKAIYIVTSGEEMSLFAARNIARAVEQFKGRGYAQLKGLILNARGVPDEVALVQAAAEELGTEVIIEIPRDATVQHCEAKNLTVIEGAPDSPLAGVYHRLAEIIVREERSKSS